MESGTLGAATGVARAAVSTLAGCDAGFESQLAAKHARLAAAALAAARDEKG
jgi:hypothetical protein